VKSGLDPYVRTGSGANGWGGYSDISVDPTDDSFWVFNQYRTLLDYRILVALDVGVLLGVV
jgi:hypothetical protein